MKIKKTDEKEKNSHTCDIIQETTEEEEKMTKNPFTPNFGQLPAAIAGRKEIMAGLDYAFKNAPGDPALNSIFVGARGTGKTAMLTYYGKKMSGEGWIVVNVSCTKGMLEDIYQQTIKNAEHLLKHPGGLSVSSAKLTAGIGGFGGELELKPDQYKANWRIRMTDIIEELNSKGIGLLITVDELNPKQEEIIEFSLIYQMWVREERMVALIMAGLPYNVSALLNDKQSSFLRRSSQFIFSRIPDYEVKDAFEETVKIGGKKIASDSLKKVVEAINGFPFMFQLVGYRSFVYAGDRSLITKDDVIRGIESATNDLKTRVLKPTLDEISDMGLQFIIAMAEDEHESDISDIAERMGKTKNYIHQYKNRLLAQGIILMTRKDHVAFALPRVKDYLNEYYR